MVFSRQVRWLLVCGWFAVLVLFDLVSHRTELAGKDLAHYLGELTSFFTIPGVLLLSLILVAAIFLIGRNKT